MNNLFSKISNRHRECTKGFTIIEVMVSLSLFIIVMTVSAGALLSIIDADQKSHELKSVIDNLNFALDDMVRDTRVGSTYICGPALVFSESGTTTGYFDDTSSDPSNGQADRPSTINASPNCPNPSTDDTYNRAFQYTTSAGVPTVYYLAPNDNGGNSIFFSQEVGSAWSVPQQFTANEVNITDMRFYVTGASSGSSDGQPYVIMTVDGYAGEGKYQSTFNLQTSVTQRLYDI